MVKIHIIIYVMSQTPFIPDIFLGFGGWGRQEAERILPLVD
jgi:hypothetical protein